MANSFFNIFGLPYIILINFFTVNNVYKVWHPAKVDSLLSNYNRIYDFDYFRIEKENQKQRENSEETVAETVRNRNSEEYRIRNRNRNRKRKRTVQKQKQCKRTVLPLFLALYSCTELCSPSRKKFEPIGSRFA